MDAKDAAPAKDVVVQALAERAAQAMYARDTATQALGIELESVAPGRACLTMRVRHDMLNGHASCHGGFIFTLADSAFAFACNSRNDRTVAAGAEVDFLRPGFEGDVLRAEAVERALKGRSGIYDITVTNQKGEVVALFRGRSHRVPGEVIAVDEA